MGIGKHISSIGLGVGSTLIIRLYSLKYPVVDTIQKRVVGLRLMLKHVHPFSHWGVWLFLLTTHEAWAR